MEDIRNYISQGMQIVHAGVSGQDSYVVRLIDPTPPHKDISVEIDINAIDNVHPNLIIKQNEGTATEAAGKLLWGCTGWHRQLRIMSIMGLTPAGDAKPGLSAASWTAAGMCAMSYDLETYNADIPRGALPPPYSQIECMSILCSCGYRQAWYTTGKSALLYAKYCHSHTDMVMEFVRAVMHHRPVWLIGYNNYQYDNTALAFHADQSLHDNKIFIEIRSSSQGETSYAYYINIPGVNNIDMYAYMDRVYRRQYKSLSLGLLATEIGVGAKISMPTAGDNANIDAMIEYNMHDCVVTTAVWDRLGLATELASLCAVMKAPMIDCVRYVTGTMASCMIASFCASHNMAMQWSECPPLAEFQGGTVLEPVRGVHIMQKVVDFASMYPTIMIGCNISTETISYTSVPTDLEGVMKHGALWWNDNTVSVRMRNEIVSFDRKTQGILPIVLTRLLAWRKQFVKGTPFSTTIKVGANSIFGLTGYPNSPMHSPRASACVTMIGRWSLLLAVSVFEFLGLSVIYGDTDSCFLSPTHKTITMFYGNFNKQIEMALYTLHAIFRYTSLENMRMEVEKDQYECVLLVNKKSYAMLEPDGNLKHKGLSSVRKDRAAICKLVLDMTLSAAMSSRSLVELYEKLATPISTIVTRTLNGELTIAEVSGVVRAEGNLCYKYATLQGYSLTQVDKIESNCIVPYNRAKILKSICGEVNRILIPCKYGDIGELLQHADDL